MHCALDVDMLRGVERNYRCIMLTQDYMQWRGLTSSASPFGGAGLAALDIGTSCPLAATAREGEDVVEAYRLTKIRKYNRIAEQANWQYRPVVDVTLVRVGTSGHEVGGSGRPEM